MMLAMQHYNASPTAPLSATNHTLAPALGPASVAEVAAVGNNDDPGSGSGSGSSSVHGSGSGSSPAMAVLNMTLGIVSNVLALFILAKAYKRMRRRSKATFLLFASSLVATDLAGHVIPGALVLQHYMEGHGLAHQLSHNDSGSVDPSCQFLGGCMVFFGLCPLFMGCAMAAERCLGVTRPLLHASWVSVTRTKLVLVLIWLMALLVALLPSFNLGRYTYQHPKTWCFISVLEDTRASDMVFVLIFALLGLTSLAVALVCNTISGITLVHARIKQRTCSRRSTKSHDIEMVVQLLGIMVTSCICWIPLLIFDLMSVMRSYQGFRDEQEVDYYKQLLLTGVRLASTNQVLDPWVYILLRRAVLRKIYCLSTCGRVNLRAGSTFRHWEISSLQSSEKKSVNRI
ncbi:prostaglandin E2 receptor EP1 subtype-like [Engraulis encrasicolus]|uniref:prostaglandin E2 receptor EP1 subtype-like n=1 Tax=Engraulis encrasicolus TaxID=184585 RepID=UPI002FD4C5EE